MKLAVFVGTRPEIIKMQPVIKEIEKRYDLIFVDTGQHFDFRMSGIFIDELELTKPDYSLRVNSGSQGAQTGDVIVKSEIILQKVRPDIVLVEGDTNSALGVALASSKLAIKVGHVEAGCRSFEKTMPEEINRTLISDIADLHFCPTPNCVGNLLREGIFSDRIFMTGHPLVDLLENIVKKLSTNSLAKIIPKDEQYAILTVHRRENIENKERISEILVALNQLAEKMLVIFPCHPHTKLQITRLGLAKHLRNLRVLNPVGYIDSLNLIRNAKYALTDSGGVQQEAALLNTPCITLREVTEWVETVNHGINFLAGYKTDRILETIIYLEDNYNKIVKALNSSQDIFGKPGVSKRILDVIEGQST